jgi:2-polyprenyl-6-methoxyphenol hydroxylase-like FAD-dependent oxidoreductase
MPGRGAEKERSPMPRNVAVVIGGSIAGLLAARALANHYGQVLVLEKDSLDDESQPRRGVPQAHHVHVLLTSGLDVIAHYFPGIVDEMVAGGVERVAWSQGARWFQGGCWKTREACGIDFYPQGRVHLEARIRARLRQHPRVAIRTGVAVQGLLVDAAGGAVTGVRLEGDGPASELAADLVVDASGRGSRLPKWLAALGHAAPPEETTRIELAYTSRLYRKTDAPRDWKGLACHPRPDCPRGGLVLPFDEQHWVVSLFGYGERPASNTPEAFLAFARQLPVPDVHDAIAGATPASELSRFEVPVQRRLRYDRLPSFPDGLLPTGDAVCSFDPVFAQGMTVACQEARALDALLASLPADAPPARLRQRYLRACQRLIEVPWLIARSEALRFAHLPERPSPAIRALQWYTQQVFTLSGRSAAAYRAFLDVMHLRSGPQALARPAVLRGVLGQVLGLGGGGRVPPIDATAVDAPP